jgi:hypothetical protein
MKETPATDICNSGPLNFAEFYALMVYMWTTTDSNCNFHPFSDRNTQVLQNVYSFSAKPKYS